VLHFLSVHFFGNFTCAKLPFKTYEKKKTHSDSEYIIWVFKRSFCTFESVDREAGLGDRAVKSGSIR